MAFVIQLTEAEEIHTTTRPHLISVLSHRQHSHFLGAHLAPPGTIAFLNAALSTH